MYFALEAILQKSLQWAAKYSMEDVSLHPPIMTEGNDRAAVRQCFKNILQAWLPHFTTQGVTLSVENHAHEKYWVFTGPADFADFVSSLSGLGALIDISHSVNDGYTVEHILCELGQLKVTGLHLSDAIPHVGMRNGTHLPVGRGQVDFDSFLHTFSRRPNVYGALEIKGQSAEIADSLARLRAVASR